MNKKNAHKEIVLAELKTYDSFCIDFLERGATPEKAFQKSGYTKNDVWHGSTSYHKELHDKSNITLLYNKPKISFYTKEGPNKKRCIINFTGLSRDGVNLIYKMSNFKMLEKKYNIIKKAGNQFGISKITFEKNNTHISLAGSTKDAGYDVYTGRLEYNMTINKSK